ncbi:MAG: hypothetical protein JO328_19935 [Hyphomicrobiales bacterium]|nr:hypothetical protein [Hyphomicrobiales bacterium]MBV9428789.1 hypothetical protein [Bradyrhizobiaceae bacterium]
MLLLAVLLGVRAARVFAMFASVRGVAMGCVGVMSSLLMVARLVVPGSLAMVAGGVAVMFGSLAVVLNRLLGHGCFPFP